MKNRKRQGKGWTKMKKIMVEVSARHVHVSEADLYTLFGQGATLTNKKDLSQPGQFACVERVDLIGPKGEIKNVSILGPTRKDTQVEISLTDARKLGVSAPIRESGDVAGSGVCKIVGPKGEVELSQGVIAAKRHIHLTPEAAREFGLTDKQVVNVKCDSDGRSLIFGDVVIRVSEKFFPAMHIDTDEANAAGLGFTSEGEILA